MATEDHNTKDILIVGSQSRGALETYYVPYLKELGFRVSVFEPVQYYSTRSILNKIKFRYFPVWLFSRANKHLIKEIDRTAPDIVWIFKGVEFFPKTLKKIKERRIFLINYNPDHPFIRTIVGNGGQNIQNCILHYDLHFSYSRDLVLQLQKQYQLTSTWLPFGFELSEDEYSSLPKEEEIEKVCFIGNPDSIRARMVKKIASLGIAIDVYGYNWNRYLDPGQANVRFFEQVNGFQYWITLRKYRVQLNIFRPHNYNSHNMRTFEIPACGGIQLAPSSDEHSFFFKENIEIFLYHDEKDLIDKIKFILNMPLSAANTVRNAARTRVIHDHHSYAERARHAGEEILKNFKILYSYD